MIRFGCHLGRFGHPKWGPIGEGNTALGGRSGSGSLFASYFLCGFGGPQVGPRGTQDVPRGSLKRPQDPSKGTPRGPKRLPRPSQEVPKCFNTARRAAGDQLCSNKRYASSAVSRRLVLCRQYGCAPSASALDAEIAGNAKSKQTRNPKRRRERQGGRRYPPFGEGNPPPATKWRSRAC